MMMKYGEGYPFLPLPTLLGKNTTTKLAITRYDFRTGACIQKYVDVHTSMAGNYVIAGYFHGVKPISLGQFYNHGETAEMISLPENLERDRHHFNKCMFRLMRRQARERH